MSTTTTTPQRPVTISIVAAVVVASGIANAGVGLLILLSRYQVAAAEVLPVSLLGAGVILFGLLTLALAGGIRRGSRLARLLLSVYLTLQLVLHAVAFATTDWDAVVVVQAIVEISLLIAVWAPPNAHHFRSR